MAGTFGSCPLQTGRIKAVGVRVYLGRDPTAPFGTKAARS